MQKWNRIEAELGGVSTVAIAGHVRPDGDAVGSSMGLSLYLQENCPYLTAVDVYLEEIPDSLKSIHGIEQIHHSCQDEKEYDLFLSLIHI